MNSFTPNLKNQHNAFISSCLQCDSHLQIQGLKWFNDQWDYVLKIIQFVTNFALLQNPIPF